MDWYIRPIATRLLRQDPGLGAIFFGVRTDSHGQTSGAFFGDASANAPFSGELPLQKEAEAAQLRLFGYLEPLDSYSFTVAFRPCCRWDGSWSPLVAMRRGPEGPRIEGQATLHRREEPWEMGLSVRGRSVDQTLDDLQLLDATAILLWRMDQVAEALEATRMNPAERESLAWALRYLEWTLGPDG